MNLAISRIALPIASALAGLCLGLALSGPRAAEPASSPRPAPLIARVWHGKTPRSRADEYESYLAAAVARFPTIAGNRGFQLLRLDGGPDGETFTEFQVISYWEGLDAIHAYAGADVRRTHDLPRDPEFLVDREPWVRNYEVRVDAFRR